MIEVLRTPLIPLQSSQRQLKGRIFLKPENLQPFGSYKIRGVASVIARASATELADGLCAASAGNMAQAVAFAARERRLPCRIFVPETAPEIKKAAIRGLGAELIEKPFHEIWEMVNGERAFEGPGLFIHPALNENLLRGYEAIADELVADLPELDAVVIPFGVGGLALGVTRRLQQIRPSVAIFLAEPKTAHPFHTSQHNGRATRIERIPSFVDAIGTPEVLPQVFAQLSPLVRASLVVGLDRVEEALRHLYYQHHLLTEGAGAAGLAAAAKLAETSGYQRIGCILTGGNIDPQVLAGLV